MPANKPSTTSIAVMIYRAAEAKAGRKFTAADRKGKGSEWAKAMRAAGALRDTEKSVGGLDSSAALARTSRLVGLSISRAETDRLRQPYQAACDQQKAKIDQVRHLLKPVPKYDPYSIDYTERSESRRIASRDAAEHNSRVIKEALEPKQSPEAVALGMSETDYGRARACANGIGMDVAQYIAWRAAAARAEEMNRQKELDREWESILSKKNDERVKGMNYRDRFYSLR
jgi:hypothetical protein